MRQAKVYRFEYFDRAAGKKRVADDWATEEAIEQMGATILRETGLTVPAEEIGAPGLRFRVRYA